MVRVQKFYELQRISTPSNRQIDRHHILVLVHFRLLSRQDTRLFLVWDWLALQQRIWPKQTSLTAQPVQNPIAGLNGLRKLKYKNDRTMTE